MPLLCPRPKEFSFKGKESDITPDKLCNPPTTDANKENLATADDTIVATNDLQPILGEDAAITLEKCVEDLQSNDWTLQFRAINALRCVIQHHAEKKEVCIIDSLRKSVSLLVPLISSLRSSLARNTMICFSEMFIRFEVFFPDGGECDFPALIRILLLKACQEKKFLREEADAALDALLTGSGYKVAFPELLKLSSNRNANLVAKCATCVEKCLQIMQKEDVVGYDEIGDVILAIGRFVEGKLAESRNAGKRSLVALAAHYPPEQFSELLETHLPPPSLRCCREVLQR